MRYAIVENGLCANVIEANSDVASQLGALRVSQDVAIGDVYSSELDAFVRVTPAYDMAYDEKGNVVTDAQGFPVMMQVGETRIIMPVIQTK